jgi:hypothetical protein
VVAEGERFLAFVFLGSFRTAFPSSGSVQGSSQSVSSFLYRAREACSTLASCTRVDFFAFSFLSSSSSSLHFSLFSTKCPLTYPNTSRRSPTTSLSTLCCCRRTPTHLLLLTVPPSLRPSRPQPPRLLPPLLVSRQRRRPLGEAKPGRSLKMLAWSCSLMNLGRIGRVSRRR